MLNFFAKRLRQLREVEREERGFTLIELLVVVIIIGILAAIAIPAYLAQRNDARQAVASSDARQAGTAINNCLLESAANTDCDSNTDLDAYGYNPSNQITTTYNTDTAGVVISTHTFNGTTVDAVYNSDTGNVTP